MSPTKVVSVPCPRCGVRAGSKCRSVTNSAYLIGRPHYERSRRGGLIVKLDSVMKVLKERRFKVFAAGRHVVDVTKVRQCSPSLLTGGILFAFEGTVSESFDAEYIHESEARPGDPVAFVVALRAVNPIELPMVDQIVAAVPDNLSVRIVASQAKRRFDQMVKGLPDTVGDTEAEVAAQLIVNVRRVKLPNGGDGLTFTIERWEGSEKDAKDTNKGHEVTR